MAEKKNTETAEKSESKAEAPAPSLTGSGDTRVQVQANVRIFDLSVGQIAYVQQTSEVEKAIKSGFLTTV